MPVREAAKVNARALAGKQIMHFKTIFKQPDLERRFATRTAAALIKRRFPANAITRVLFLVERIPLAVHPPDYPCYVLRAGRRFQDEKQITITTLQSMINIYGHAAHQ